MPQDTNIFARTKTKVITMILAFIITFVLIFTCTIKYHAKKSLFQFFSPTPLHPDKSMAR
ncbi:MAG TPA: hypothetical protein DD454_04305 [Candidatus Moranbacteria bacterium]|nr:hypothetical protein [Candidatus Moranbacteria bacterium]